MSGLVITEAQFQERVMEAASALGWRVWHHRPARTNKGWRTAGTGDKGVPDLVLARNGTVLLVELKSDTGKPGEGQQEWADAIGAEHHRWWAPRDWPVAERELRTLGRAA